MRLLALIIGLACAASQAEAQDATPEVGEACPSPDDARARGTAVVAERGEWSEAYRLFRCAFDGDPSVVNSINLASAEARTGRVRQAIARYEALLESDSDELEPLRARVEQLLRTLRATGLSYLRIDAPDLTDADVIELDGDAIELQTDTIPVNPGRHHVARIRPEARVSDSITVAAGATAAIRLEVPVAMTELEAPGRSRKVWWVVLGVVVLAGAAAGLVAWALRPDQAQTDTDLYFRF